MSGWKSVTDCEVGSCGSPDLLSTSSALVEVVEQQTHGLSVFGVEKLLFHLVARDLDANVFLALLSLFSQEVD